MIFVGVGIVVVLAIIALTYWAVVTKDYGPNPLDEIQYLSNMAAELAETAAIYKEHGMDEEAEAALDEAEKLNNKVWEVINGANHGT